MTNINRGLSSSQIIILGFAALILLGSLLLMLPFATQSGQGASFFDALFTSTSAVCVTGLVIHDTATYWNTFGHVIIITLIQIGGMGIVTVAVAVFVLSGKRIDLKQRSTMQEAISAHKVGGIVRLTGFIIKTSFLIELIGALIMAPTFIKEFGILKGIWYAVFHSISAFCNAGIDLMGVKAPYSSLTHFVGNPAVNFAIMALIVTGGIGFMTWEDIKTNKLRIREYRMQSKVILSTTLSLILLPAIYFYFFEFSGMPLNKRVWSSLFQSVTPRTAGFNVVDLTKISEVGTAITILLMLIGGSPGSTAGGMKTTTLAVMLSTMVSVFQRREHTHFFGRRISSDTIRSAATVLMMYISLFLTGGFIISRVEGLSLLACLYETASAVGTVGLTLGITPGLGTISKIILILLMYIGRVGGLTLIFSTLTASRGNTSRLPQEKITVG
ncbi:MAG TPA: Trk family potassium uptake protein [Christensenellaceae bacterium]|nr:Trk family potassium uptake protein [Christensenellaceae bacterium]